MSVVKYKNVFLVLSVFLCLFVSTAFVNASFSFSEFLPNNANSFQSNLSFYFDLPGEQINITNPTLILFENAPFVEGVDLVATSVSDDCGGTCEEYMGPTLTLYYSNAGDTNSTETYYINLYVDGVYTDHVEGVNINAGSSLNNSIMVSLGEGTYDFNVCVEYPGDANSSNNCMQMNDYVIYSSVPPPEVEDCTNGIDDDADLDIDCADSECNSLPGPNGETCEYGAELTCDDTYDNDGDGSADLLDSDCLSPVINIRADSIDVNDYVVALGDSVSVDCNYTNTGDDTIANYDVNLQIYISGEGWFNSDNYSGTNLLSGNSSTHNFILGTEHASVGDYNLRCLLTVADDSNSDDNSIMTNITIANDVDLVAGNIDFNDSTLYGGDSVKVSCSYSNQGTATADSYDVNLDLYVTQGETSIWINIGSCHGTNLESLGASVCDINTTLVNQYGNAPAGDYNTRCVVLFTNDVDSSNDINQTIMTILPDETPLSNGSGTEEDPYQIYTLADLNAVRNYLDANFVLSNDINAYETRTWNDGNGWDPIGDLNNPFTGLFDGNGNTISNLYINNNDGNIGLFGVVEINRDTNFSNVNLTDININDVYWAGGLIGLITIVDDQNYTITFSDINVSGTVTSDNGGSIGSIIGRLGVDENSYDANIVLSNCDSNVTINSESYIGGLIGTSYIDNLQIEHSNNYGTISSEEYAGGLIGASYSENLDINDCNNYGNVSASNNDYAGGLIGYIGDYNNIIVEISNSSNYGDVSVDIEFGQYAGGIIGAIDDSIYNLADLNLIDVHNYGDISGGNYSGGLVGSMYNLRNIYVSECYSTGGVSGSNYIGGLIGSIDVSLANENYLITKSYVINNYISGSRYVGGLIGSIEDANVTECYTANQIVEGHEVSYSVGGLIGRSVNSYISDTYSWSDVSGGQVVGGLIGYLTLGMASLHNSYSTGSVTSLEYYGGLVGYLEEEDIHNVFTTSQISGVSSSDQNGGAIGYVSLFSELENIYWYDQYDGGMSCYVGGDENCFMIEDANGGLSYFYDSTNAPLSVWDFDTIWYEQDENYPILRWQLTGDETYVDMNAISVTFTPESVIYGDENNDVNLSITFNNIGDANATNDFTITYYVEDVNVGSTIVSTDVNILDSITWEYSYTPNVVGLDLNVSACIDYSGDSNSENDCVYSTEDLNIYYRDLNIEALEYVSGSEIYGEDLNMDLNIANNGTYDANDVNVELLFFESENSDNNFSYLTTIDFLAESVTTITLIWTDVNLVGPVDVNVTLESSNDYNELNNNRLFGSVVDVDYIDLDVSVDINVDDVNVGHSTDVSCIIRNLGTMNLNEDYNVYLYVDGVEYDYETVSTMLIIPQGIGESSHTSTFSWTPTQKTTYDFNCVAILDVYTDYNETDNSAMTEVEITNSDTNVDLAVAGILLNKTTEGTVTVDCNVGNLGTEDATNDYNVIFSKLDGSEYVYVDSLLVTEDLNVGEYARVGAFSWIAEAGSYTLKCEVNYDVNNYSGFDENLDNNSYTKAVTISALEEESTNNRIRYGGGGSSSTQNTDTENSQSETQNNEQQNNTQNNETNEDTKPEYILDNYVAGELTRIYIGESNTPVIVVFPDGSEREYITDENGYITDTFEITGNYQIKDISENGSEIVKTFTIRESGESINDVNKSVITEEKESNMFGWIIGIIIVLLIIIGFYFSMKKPKINQ